MFDSVDRFNINSVYNEFLSWVLLLKEFWRLYWVDRKLMDKILNYRKNRLWK